MSSHADHGVNATFRQRTESPLSAGVLSSQTDPLRTFRCYLVRAYRPAHCSGMLLLRILAVGSLLMLGGCSYPYDILATMIDGKLAFIVDTKSPSKPSSCLTTITVAAETNDNVQRVNAGVVWWNSVGYECATRFPVIYGIPLAGEPRSPEQTNREVHAKPLTPGVIYEVVVVAGATGYGGGRFRLTANGGVENLPQRVSANVP